MHAKQIQKETQTRYIESMVQGRATLRKQWVIPLQGAHQVFENITQRKIPETQIHTMCLACLSSLIWSGRKRHGFWVKMFLSGSLQPCILFFSLTSGSRCVLCFTLLYLIHSLSLQFGLPKIPVDHQRKIQLKKRLKLKLLKRKDFLAKNGEEEKAQWDNSWWGTAPKGRCRSRETS